MRRLTPPRRDHWSIFGRNRANPFTASWSWTSCSLWLRVHSACHAGGGDGKAPSRVTPASCIGEITRVVIAPFIGWASPPLVHGALSGPNRTGPYSSFVAAGVRRADTPDRLFHRDALREIPGLVHVAVPEHGDVVRQELQRNRPDDRRQELGRRRDVEHVIRSRRDVDVPVARERDHEAVPSLDLFEVPEHLLVETIARYQHDHRQLRVDESDRPVLHLARGIAFRVGVRQLLELERSEEHTSEL